MAVGDVKNAFVSVPTEQGKSAWAASTAYA